MPAKRRLVVQYRGALTGTIWYCQKLGKAVFSSSMFLANATIFTGERKAKDFAALWHKHQPRCKLEILDLETKQTIL